MKVKTKYYSKSKPGYGKTRIYEIFSPQGYRLSVFYIQSDAKLLLKHLNRGL